MSQRRRRRRRRRRGKLGQGLIWLYKIREQEKIEYGQARETRMEGCEDSRCQARETRMEGCEDSRCARAVGSYKAAGKQAYGRMRTDGGQKRGLAYTMNHRKRGREEERKRGREEERTRPLLVYCDGDGLVVVVGADGGSRVDVHTCRTKAYAIVSFLSSTSTSTFD